MRGWRVAVQAGVAQLLRQGNGARTEAFQAVKNTGRGGTASTSSSSLPQGAEAAAEGRSPSPHLTRLQQLFERIGHEQHPHPECQAHPKQGFSALTVGLGVTGVFGLGVAAGANSHTASRLHLPHSLDQWLDSLRSYAQHMPALPSISGGASSAATPLDAHGQHAAPLGPHFIADAAAKAAPAVVNITVQRPGQQQHHHLLSAGGSGSGFIFDPSGSILTNAHVISDALPRSASQGTSGQHSLLVSLQDGRVFQGTVTSFDRASDLAVIKVDSPVPLPAARLGDSRRLRVGEWVVALGSPLHLQNSVTAGIVSCVDRKAVELGLAGARTEYIQTDAAINRGNSGGPLVNIAGEVVGLACFKALSADGVSFAIPIDVAKDVIEQLQRTGHVVRPYIGIKMLQLNEHIAAQIQSRDPTFPKVLRGILVPHVTPGSPAERGGLMKGDVIAGFAGSSEATTSALIRALGRHVGRPMPMQIVRQNNERITLHITASSTFD